jgi:hypothetical protein
LLTIRLDTNSLGWLGHIQIVGGRRTLILYIKRNSMARGSIPHWRVFIILFVSDHSSLGSLSVILSLYFISKSIRALLRHYKIHLVLGDIPSVVLLLIREVLPNTRQCIWVKMIILLQSVLNGR